VPELENASPRQRTRDAILAAAIALYRHEGYGAVTMRAIAQQLGFSTPAIYNYFISKQEIFVALQERGLRLMAEMVLTPSTQDALTDLRSIFVQYYKFSQVHPEYFTLLYVDPSTPHVDPSVEPLARMTSETSSRLQRCLNAGILPRETSPMLPSLLWAQVHGAAVLRQVQAMAPNSDFEELALTGLDTTRAAVRAGLFAGSRAHVQA
jgi:AcrR family transcriptional regulator